jgi:hydrogenase nickel incorporation protein HypA/HybF
MHELSVCQALVRQLERVSAGNGGGRVERAVLRIGPLSGIEVPLLERAFPLAAAGTLAEGAALVIEPVPAKVRCSECDAESEVAVNRMVCGACGSYRCRLVCGDEMLLQTVELAHGQPEAVP